MTGSPRDAARRILFVHAHPDDETVGTGATLAHYAADGAHVTLVTCTIGEEGEIHVPALAQLEAAQADQLGGYRITELAAACEALGVTDHRILGGAGHYRDSGMMGTPANENPRCFWRADLDEAAKLLLEVFDDVRPQVVVTYDPNGFYGHPDHIQAHRVTMRAVEMAHDAGYPPAKVYWTAIPHSVLVAGMEAFRDSTENPFEGAEDAQDVPFGTPDEEVHARVDASGQADRKFAAVRAHATQIPTDSWLYTLAGEFGGQFMGVEYYTLVAGDKGPGSGDHDRESDLFAGLD
ncbi:MAG TPA: N-acetyl-1-D-myo-inositol-2-amino-2-deoxy-alpha-D-glucopyranoside deacetylase [Micromonosporaceae bacterium]|nr:N-acetyl-1-D-myo-inositol-2-amino-2-deoxy-alpha-D-glucopyranoside deacetylase [Micromonosporaceae bacterium]